MNSKGIPIYFINRDRVTALRKMLFWLLDNGHSNLNIIDNNSSYPPLLQFYKEMAGKIRVITLSENCGPWVFWEREFDKELASNYIISDSDLIPAEYCPANLVEKLNNVMSDNPSVTKVGPSLRIDNLPKVNEDADLVYRHESGFWQYPLGRGLFSAPIDTTFALYRKQAGFTNEWSKNIRLGYPYSLEHTPWYVASDSLSGEEDYYRKHIDPRFSWWSGGQLKGRMRKKDRVANFDSRKRILNLCCGDNYIPGWTNVDSDGFLLDYKWEIDKSVLSPLPFPDNYFDGVYAESRFAQILNVGSLMRELHRVCKDKARFIARMPYGSLGKTNSKIARTHYCEDSYGGAEMGPPAFGDRRFESTWRHTKTTLFLAQSLRGAVLDASFFELNRNLFDEVMVECMVSKSSIGNSRLGSLDLEVATSPLRPPIFD